MAKIKETLPIIIEDPPKEINSAILDISPTAQDSPNFITKDGEFQGDTKLPKYFNMLNVEGIEKKTYQED